MEIDATAARTLERRAKTIDVCARITWLVRRVCEQFGDVNEDVVGVVLETLLLLVVGCHRGTGCWGQRCERRRVFGEMVACDVCLQYAHVNVWRQTFWTLDNVPPFMSCTVCAGEWMVTCFMCDYTTCERDEQVCARYAADVIDGADASLEYREVSTCCDADEHFMMRCAQCVRYMCHRCRAQYCESGPWYDFHKDFVFLCHQCRPRDTH